MRGGNKTVLIVKKAQWDSKTAEKKTVTHYFFFITFPIRSVNVIP